MRRIVAANNGQIVVVVSALGGITDRLLATAAAAAAGKPDYTDSLAEIMARHRTTIDETVASGLRGAIRRRTDELLDELANILRGVYLIRDLSPRTGDAIVSYGERLSSGIVAAVLEGSRLYDAREFIRTKTDFGKHIAEPDLTEKLIRERLADRPRVSVVPGFIASDCATGDVTNLGRGGSDYTAALIAAALNAETLEIWTDVDGFMTADPRVISDAYVIDRLSFEEAMELCNFGAKVVYPPTIFPVYHRDIPILIKNTFNPEAPGTFISRERVQGRDKAIKGISSINNTCLVTIQGLGMVGVIGVNHRIFRTLARAGISVFFVSQAASENTTSIGLRNEDADLAIAMLTREFAPEIEIGEVGSITAEHDLATIAVVGDDMKHTPGIAGKLFGTLGRNGINVIACTQGASETNISVVVTLESLPKAINVIHDSFFLSEYQVLNIFVAGVGQVGRDLLEQIRLQRRTLMADNGLQIRVVGIANSRKRAHRRRRHRPERLPPAARRGGNALDAGEPARRDSRPEHLQLGLRRLHGQRGGGGALPFAARPQRLGGGLQQDRRVVRLRPLPRAQNRLAQTQREIPLRDQRRRRSADHQHDLRPDKQRRPHPAHRGGGFGDTQLHLRPHERRNSVQPRRTHGSGGRLCRTRSARRPERHGRHPQAGDPHARSGLCRRTARRGAAHLPARKLLRGEHRRVLASPGPKRTSASKHGGDGSKPKGNGCVSSPAWRTDAPRSGSKRSTTKARSTTFRAATTSSSSPPNATANTRSKSRGTAPARR